MTIVARVQIESEFQLLKLESAKRIAAINEHFRNLRFEARVELAENLKKVSSLYQNCMAPIKQARTQLWLEKCSIERTIPFDADALAKNRAESVELKHQGAVYTAKLDADIKALKREYRLKKQSLVNEENAQLLAVKDDITRRRTNLMFQLAQLAGKGGAE